MTMIQTIKRLFSFRAAMTLLVLMMTAATAWAGGTKTLPYSYGFENNDWAAEGWTTVDCTAKSKIDTFLPHGGKYAFMFSPKDSPQYLISPEIDSEGADYLLSFYFSNIDEANTFQFGYSTTTNDISAFTWEDVASGYVAQRRFQKQLSAEVKYVAIKANIASKYDELVFDDFTFLALVPLSLPFSEGFENDIGLWQVVNGSGKTRITSVFGETNAFSFWGDAPQYLISPELNCPAEITVSLYYCISNTDMPKTFQVGYSTTTRDVTAFTWDDEITSTIWDYLKYEHNFPAGTKFIAVKYNTSSDQFLHIDNVSIFVDGVLPPAKMSTSSISCQSAMLSWDVVDGATSYAYQYKKVRESTWSDEVTTTSTSAVIYGLTADTDYDARVKAIVGSDASIYTSTKFTTATDLPYEQNFESGYGRWTMVDCDYDETETLDQIWDTGRRTQAAHDSSVGFQFTPHGKAQYLISPRFSGDVSITMSFYYRLPTNIDETIYVGYSTTTNDKDAFTFGDAITVDSSLWTKYEQTFPSDARYFAVKYASNSYKLYIDDFSFQESSDYAKPTKFGYHTLTENEITISWNIPNNSTGFAYQYKKANDVAWSTEATVHWNSVTLSGLTPNTFYNFRVRALYPGNSSNYANYSFQTEANIVDLPYTDDFENGMGGWRMRDCEGTTKIADVENPHSGKHIFWFFISDHDQYLFSPHFAGGVPMKVSFYYQNYENYPGVMSVGYTSNKDDDITWVDEMMTIHNNEWTLYETTIPAEAQYVVICSCVEGYWIFIDDFTIQPTAASVTFAKEGYGTYYNGSLDAVLPSGMKARIVTASADGGQLTYETIADGNTTSNTVPAGTAVMLQVAGSDEAQNLWLTLTSPTAAAIDQTNLLHGSDAATATTGAGYGGKYYKLTYGLDNTGSGGTDNTNVLGWYWGANNGRTFESAAHKAWLALPASNPNLVRSFIGLPDFDDSTGIIAVEGGESNSSNSSVYTIDGRKVGTAADFDKQSLYRLPKGMYIVNGRKVVIK